MAGILSALARAVKPGIETGKLEEMANELIEKAHGRPAFKNYNMPTGEIFPTALCTSINNEVVHVPALPSRVLREGDIISIDLGMEYPLSNGRGYDVPVNKYSLHGGYFTDIAATIPVGEIGSEVRKLLTITRECLEIGIKLVKPGNTLSDLGAAIQRHAETAGFGVVRELVGHGVGHKVHEEPQVPHYKIKNNNLENATLQTGMVIAIEPMINMGGWEVKTKDDGFSVITADGSLSAQFEHTVAVTESGHLVLTAP